MHGPYVQNNSISDTMFQKYGFLLSLSLSFMSVTAETDGPKPIRDFYDKILNNAGSNAQNFALLRQTVHDDWEIFPKNGFYDMRNKPDKMDGPIMLSKYLQMWSTMLPQMTRERFETVMCRYWALG